MHVFDLKKEQQWSSEKHVEKILGKMGGGDVTVACWEPGQISPYHCHPHATEIYFCFEGGGVMRTPAQTVAVVPGSFVVHPPGELHGIRQRAVTHAPLSRPLRNGHDDSAFRMARQLAVETVAAGHGIFQSTSAGVNSPSQERIMCFPRPDGMEPIACIAVLFGRETV